jgi:hypothetical protein
MPFLTIAGENKIALNQSVNGGLTIANFVLANVPNLDAEPADRITVMPDSSLIVDTLPFTKRGYVNPNQVVYSLVMGSNLGDYDFNWIGLVDEDGVLVVVSHVPNIQKRKSVGGVPGNTITRNFLIEYTDIQNITATTVPVETWQIDFSDRLNGIDERERLANLDVYGHEGFLDDGWKVTGSAGAYSVAAGIGYVGGIRAKNVTPHEVITSTFPNEIWLNVSLQGDISDMGCVAEFVIDTGPFADYVDVNGITHYLTKIADIDAAGEVSDGRGSSYLKDIKSYVDSSIIDSNDQSNALINELRLETNQIITSSKTLVQFKIFKDLSEGIQEVVGGSSPFFTTLEIGFTPKFDDSLLIIRGSGNFRVIRTDGTQNVCGMDIQLYNGDLLLEGKFGFIYDGQSNNIHHNPNMLYVDSSTGKETRNYRVALLQHTSGNSLSYFPHYGNGSISIEEYQNV